MDLIFLRHGQTDWNLAGRLQGRTDIPLNDTGIKSAEKAREILKNYTFDAVYSSPLLRARQTMEIACPNASAVLDDRLMEWSFGPWEGLKYDREVFEDRWFLGKEPIEGMEQIEGVIARAKSFYGDLLKKHGKDRVLVVSHGGFSASLRVAICGMKPDENLWKYCLPNATPVLFRSGQEPIILGVEGNEK